MLVSVYVTKDSKFFLYVPFNPKFKNNLELYEDIPTEVKAKFKDGRFIKTINIKEKKLVQISNEEEFNQALANNGFYLFKIDESFVEKQIQQHLKTK
ncbi:hypothetical protein CKF54_07785 [Psittacicella hinzii]|uniref:YcgL domain-containing protein n=1 Tax=Psittacicella hinzii TaxID=2028575 RepID=A0A3A1XYI0_9GAMM|nr:YcgL domain-containing protein [Psittacicella hinzii]RIY31082.1 hypothetical protein CKF54_07785 [Psittacicella hinzii]